MTWVNIIVDGMSREQKIKAGNMFVKKYNLKTIKTPEYLLDKYGEDVYCFAFDNSPSSDKNLVYGIAPPAYDEIIVSIGVNNLGRM